MDPADALHALAAAPLRLALAGGGTGGHVVPGLHLVSHLSAAGGLASLLWFGAGRLAESRALQGLERAAGGAPAETVRLRLEPAGGGAPGRLRLLGRTPLDTLRADRALAVHRSEILLGLGGYTSLPAVLAARRRGLPVALLEINAAPGKATRVLGKLARRVFHAWPGTLPAAGEDEQHRLSGPPLAAEFLAGPPDEGATRRSRAELGFDAARPLLVVLGGSQGAGGINAFLKASAAELSLRGLQVLHQVGPGRRMEGPPDSPYYRAVEYIDDVPAALRAATLVLCRGGASTLAEVGALQRPALVVPFPHHADRHQERNAEQLGAGVELLPEQELGPAAVARLLELAGPAGLHERAFMSASLAASVPLDAAPRILAGLAELTGRV